MSIQTENSVHRDSTRRKSVIMIAKLAFGLAILGWLIATGKLNLESYQSLLRPGAVLAVLGIGIAQFAGMSITLSRWYLLTSAQKIPLRFTEVMWLGYRGIFAGLLIPGMLGLEGVRLLYLRKYHPNCLSTGLASIMVDRVVGLLGLLLLVIMFGVFYTLREQVSDFSRILGYLSVSTIVIVLLSFALLRLMRYVGEAWPELQRINRLSKAIDRYREHPIQLTGALLLSMVGHFCLCLAAWCGMIALRQQVALLAISTVTPLVTVLRILPLSPLGLGFTDAAAEELYPLVGMEGGAENQMLVRGVFILVSLLCGVAFLVRPSSKKVEQQDDLETGDFNAEKIGPIESSERRQADPKIRL
ncbi:MAG: hypothetical protein CMJ77_22625 [Planctomycetaceae bacterium]|nr:hypothetical protein [Planctomycetaceae bacterium]